MKVELWTRCLAGAFLASLSGYTRPDTTCGTVEERSLHCFALAWGPDVCSYAFNSYAKENLSFQVPDILGSPSCGVTIASILNEGFSESDLALALSTGALDQASSAGINSDSSLGQVLGVAAFITSHTIKFSIFQSCMNKCNYQLSPDRSKPEEYTSGIYRITSCGAIKDTFTGLEWYIGPDETVTWDSARQWALSLNQCGPGWRMPSISELRTLYNRSYSAGIGYYTQGKHWPAHIHESFSGIGNGSWVWSSQLADRKKAKSYNFNQGLSVNIDRSNTKYTTRAFAVR